MNLTSRTPRIELFLRPRELLNLDNSRHRTTIECRNGVIWVTCTGEHYDHILYAGWRYTPRSRGSIVIEAIDEARVDLEENR